MEAAEIIALIQLFGPPAIKLIDGLVVKLETKGSVTAAEWSTMTADLTVSAQDKMKAQLVAAGIDLTSPQAVSLIALAR